MAIALKIPLQGARQRKESQQRGFLFVLSLPKWKEKWRLFAEIPGQLHRTSLFRDREKTERPGLLESVQLSSRFTLPEQIGLLFTYLTFLFIVVLTKKDVGKSYWIGYG